MLLERNDNKQLADLAATKHHVPVKKSKIIQKENKVSLNNLCSNYNSIKKPFEQTIQDPVKKLLTIETDKIKSNNLKKIVAFELSKSKGNYRSDFLQRHNISEDIRTRMVK